MCHRYRRINYAASLHEYHTHIVMPLNKRRTRYECHFMNLTMSSKSHAIRVNTPLVYSCSSAVCICLSLNIEQFLRQKPSTMRGGVMQGFLFLL